MKKRWIALILATLLVWPLMQVEAVKNFTASNVLSLVLLNPIENRTSSLNVKTVNDETLFLITDNTSAPTTIFVGKTFDQASSSSEPDQSAAIWQIYRESVSGFFVSRQWAGGDVKFDQVWNDRSALFPAPGFANNFSIQFDGANDFINVDDNAAIDFDFRTEPASWNFWIKITDTMSPVVYFEKRLSNVGWSINIDSNELTLELLGGSLGNRIRVRTQEGTLWTSRAHTGLWIMVTVTYDGSGDAAGVNFYLNAVVEVSNQTQNDTLSSDTSVAINAAIAATSGGSDNVGPANMDEVSIWDVELSSAEITTIFNAGNPIDLQDLGVSPITVSLNYWNRMGDGPSDSFPTIEDIENNIVGTMVNMTAGDIETETP